jgi:hypothetical protein
MTSRARDTQDGRTLVEVSLLLISLTCYELMMLYET